MYILSGVVPYYHAYKATCLQGHDPISGYQGHGLIHVFFYKHGVFQSEARICLSFSQIEPQNMLRICLS